MKSKNMFVVATTRQHDVEVLDVFDGDVFTLDTILAGLDKKLKHKDIQVSKVDGNAYIDVIDEHDELEKTYSIISKKTFTI